MSAELHPVEAPTAQEICGEGAMTVMQAVTFTGLSRRTLYTLVEEGRLHRIRVGGRVLLARRQLVALLAAGLER